MPYLFLKFLLDKNIYRFCKGLFLFNPFLSFKIAYIYKSLIFENSLNFLTFFRYFYKQKGFCFVCKVVHF